MKCELSQNSDFLCNSCFCIFSVAMDLYHKSQNEKNSNMRFLKSTHFNKFIRDMPRYHVFTHNSCKHMAGVESERLVNEHMRDMWVILELSNVICYKIVICISRWDIMNIAPSFKLSEAYIRTFYHTYVHVVLLKVHTTIHIIMRMYISSYVRTYHHTYISSCVYIIICTYI